MPVSPGFRCVDMLQTNHKGTKLTKDTPRLLMALGTDVMIFS